MTKSNFVLRFTHPHSPGTCIIKQGYYITDASFACPQNTQSGSQSETWGVVFSVNASINAAVLNAGGGLGGVILLMFLHVGAILLTPFTADRSFSPCTSAKPTAS